MIDPVYVWTPSAGIGAIEFFDNPLFSAWRNNLLVAALKHQKTYRLVSDGHKVVKEEVILRESGRMIAARAAVGDMEGARLLVELLKKDLNTRRAAGIDVAPGYLNEGYADYLIGERGKGLSARAKVVELGLYVPVFQAYMKELWTDPDFAPLLAQQQAKQTVQR